MKYSERLSAWLWSRKKDYREGVRLLTDLNFDPGSISFLNRSQPTKIHWSVLERKLSNYARVNGIKPAPSLLPVETITASVSYEKTAIEKAGIERPKVDKNPVVRYEDLPANLQVRFDENGRLNTEMKSFHASLKLLKDDPDAREKRKELAGEILLRQKSIRENWDLIDAWWNRQKESDPLQMAAEGALARDRRIKADLSYIRRFLGKEKVRSEVELRMKELDQWNIDYGYLINRFDGNWK